MAEPILNKSMEKAQSESYLSITSNDIKINLSKEFLEELQKNTYHGWIDEDVIDHIAKENMQTTLLITAIRKQSILSLTIKDISQAWSTKFRADPHKPGLEEEKARRRGKVYNWETATYGKIWDNEDVHDLGSVETEFPAIVFNDTLTSEATLSCEPTVSSLNNDEIDFRISFDKSDDEDCTSVCLCFLSPRPDDDLDYFKDFEKEFPAIVYNDAQTSKLDFSTKPVLNPQHIDKFNLKDETSLSECDV
ncbi:hypothetical protein Tco_0600173 [Tanacetum coccineum]|uniref:Uncharacterized protein n=1 Tax=Tanacetum coccineum TaxID=301880 RepID=A0ABQ4WB45_9ASTR